MLDILRNVLLLGKVSIDRLTCQVNVQLCKHTVHFFTPIFNSTIEFFIPIRFEGDTCKALEDFQQDPYNSSLSSILPCDELPSANPVLDNLSHGIYDLINEVFFL